MNTWGLGGLSSVHLIYQLKIDRNVSNSAKKRLKSKLVTKIKYQIKNTECFWPIWHDYYGSNRFDLYSIISYIHSALEHYLWAQRVR